MAMPTLDAAIINGKAVLSSTLTNSTLWLDWQPGHTNAIAVLQLTVSNIGVCSEYVADVKNAPRDRDRIKPELDGLTNLPFGGRTGLSFVGLE
ncbi:hypothetical protein JB92DRAFT_3150291 [Gautieria morchelliformis]|nr:hypothetical protein JB92DRAFT_3150291 [Gautieria morchelliformis]